MTDRTVGGRLPALAGCLSSALWLVRLVVLEMGESGVPGCNESEWSSKASRIYVAPSGFSAERGDGGQSERTSVVIAKENWLAERIEGNRELTLSKYDNTIVFESCCKSMASDSAGPVRKFCLSLKKDGKTKGFSDPLDLCATWPGVEIIVSITECADSKMGWRYVSVKFVVSGVDGKGNKNKSTNGTTSSTRVNGNCLDAGDAGRKGTTISVIFSKKMIFPLKTRLCEIKTLRSWLAMDKIGWSMFFINSEISTCLNWGFKRMSIAA